MRADLHTHSKFSDGSSSIEEVAKIGVEKGLDIIAITDHDTVAHMRSLPINESLRIVMGIEISAIHKQSNIKAHILGYNISKPDIVESLTLPLLKARHSNTEKQAEILISHGYYIDYDKLPRGEEPYLYKVHLMDWFVATKQADEMYGEFYYEVFKNNGICDIDIEYIDVFDAVKVIKEAGGLAVLAHPGQQQNYFLIPDLVDIGLAGIEINHYAHNEKDREIIRDYASRFSLFLTGGSDFHGRYSDKSNVGDYLSEDSGIRAICG